MNQPIPKVTGSNVIGIVRRDFPNEQFDTVMSILNDYGTEEGQRSISRVRLAVLKLADGDLQALRREIDVAKRDYRDVLSSFPPLPPLRNSGQILLNLRTAAKASPFPEKMQ